MVKRLLGVWKIDYEVVDLTDNLDLWAEIAKKAGGNNVPITTNGKDYVIGYNPIKIRALA